jgi:hypothetical protein
MVPPQDKINGSPTTNDAFQGGANFALILEICRYNVCREAPNARESVEFSIPASAIRSSLTPWMATNGERIGKIRLYLQTDMFKAHAIPDTLAPQPQSSVTVVAQ